MKDNKNDSCCGPVKALFFILDLVIDGGERYEGQEMSCWTIS